MLPSPVRMYSPPPTPFLLLAQNSDDIKAQVDYKPCLSRSSEKSCLLKFMTQLNHSVLCAG